MGKKLRNEEVITFTEFSKVNEFYGGSTKDLLLPRVENLIGYLQDYKERLDNGKTSESEDNKVDNAWSHILMNVSLEALAHGARTAKDVKGMGETLPQKIKRSARDF